MLAGAITLFAERMNGLEPPKPPARPTVMFGTMPASNTTLLPVSRF